MGNKRIYIASLLLFALSCCCFDEGTIVGKDHDDAFIIYQPMFIGKVMHMQPIFIDESWKIKIRSNDKDVGLKLINKNGIA